MVDPEDRGAVFDGVQIGRPATGALLDAGYRKNPLRHWSERVYNVELRGLEPLTPTLPGAGEGAEQVRHGAKTYVVGVVRCVTVVGVVVRNVVSQRTRRRLTIRG
jgi:hypothetical protein